LFFSAAGHARSIMLDQSHQASPVPAPLEAGVPSTTVALGPPTALLRVTQDPRRLDAWALVLISRGVQPLLRWVDGDFELHVAQGDMAAATAELDASDAEELASRRAQLADAAAERHPASRHGAAGAILVALLLLVFFAVTGPRAGGSEWFAAGASDAERVVHGEWWRAVTALTLHADSAHVVSNVGIGTLVVGAVMRSEGVGWGAALVLASGTAGNLLNAWVHQTLHRSVGFSTAVFGAIGLLAGFAYVHARARANRLRPAWTALGVGVALLAMLGTGGERTDVLAHLFGGLAGLGLGLFTAWSGLRPRTPLGQWLTGVSVAMSVVAAWAVALA
jgi:membrane associated rhomboid family serine protease